MLSCLSLTHGVMSKSRKKIWRELIQGRSTRLGHREQRVSSLASLPGSYFVALQALKLHQIAYDLFLRGPLRKRVRIKDPCTQRFSTAFSSHASLACKASLLDLIVYQATNIVSTRTLSCISHETILDRHFHAEGSDPGSLFSFIDATKVGSKKRYFSFSAHPAQRMGPNTSNATF